MDLEGLGDKITLIHEDLKDRLEDAKETNEKAHDEIKTKQDYTNGDVRDLKRWRAWQKGGIAVLSFFTIFALVILIDTIKSQNIELEKQSIKFENLSNTVDNERTSLVEQFRYRLEELEKFTNIKQYETKR